jgi:RNA polymerase sigma-70 factor (ECF subfamily)
MAGPSSPDSALPGAGDLELVRAARAGDARALEGLARAFSRVPAFVRAQNRRFGAPLGEEELRDVVQETFRAAWAKLDEFRGRAALDTWLFRFGTNELLKALERRRREAHVRPSDLSAFEARPGRGAPPLDPLVLHQSLRRLEPHEEDLVRARHFEERSFEDIARAQGEPLGTVKARYYRALDKLRLALAGSWRRART